ncbi:MAG: DUF1992 domain-containing protein [Verrucomicrobiales bacterium]
MVWEILAENKIQEAIEQGLFDHLPGKGKPLNLDAYFDTPAAERAGFSVLKNAGVVPPEVEMLKNIEQMKQMLEACPDPDKRQRIREKIGALQVSYNMLMERRRVGPRPNSI